MAIKYVKHLETIDRLTALLKKAQGVMEMTAQSGGNDHLIDMADEIAIALTTVEQASPTPPPADTGAGDAETDARAVMIARQACIFEQNMEIAGKQWLDVPDNMKQWALSVMTAVQNIAAYLDMPITEQGERTS
jgi:hypothetical protein